MRRLRAWLVRLQVLRLQVLHPLARALSQLHSKTARMMETTATATATATSVVVCALALTVPCGRTVCVCVFDILFRCLLLCVICLIFSVMNTVVGWLYFRGASAVPYACPNSYVPTNSYLYVIVNSTRVCKSVYSYLFFFLAGVSADACLAGG
jgi:hypothetical protein